MRDAHKKPGLIVGGAAHSGSAPGSPGANDNASGSVAAIEPARALRELAAVG